MKPLRSGWNLTPTSMAAGSAFDGLTGVAELGQMVHGHVCGVGVAVGGPCGVLVGVGVAVPAGAPWVSVEKVAPPADPPRLAFVSPVLSIALVPLAS